MLLSKRTKLRPILLATVSAIVFPNFAAAQSFHATPAAENNDTVSVWTRTNYAGPGQTFSQGIYTANDATGLVDGLGVLANNGASSVRVGANAITWLCDTYDESAPGGAVDLGDCYSYDGQGTSTLVPAPQRFNDLTSTVVVTVGNNQRETIGATVWANNFSGTSSDFKAGGYGSNELGAVGNDAISSLRVDPGFQVVACTNSAGGAAQCAMFPEGDYNVSVMSQNGLDETISWLSVVRQATNPAVIGEFGDVIDLPFVPIHMYLLTDGRVMFNDVTGDDGNAGTGEYGIWNPATNEIVEESTFAPGTSLFCAGFVHLPNGNLFGVATGGGGNTVDLTMEYHVDTGRWELAPVMNHARYYPSASLTPEGNVLVTGGNDVDLFTKLNPRQTPTPITIPEVYENGAFRSLPGAELDFTNFHGPTNDAAYWPWVQAAPNGRMFMSGPDVQMRFIDTDGEGSLENLGARPDNAVRTYGSYATFDIGKQIIAGGGNSLASTALIDFNSDNPTLTPVGDLNIGRRQHDMTIMADGKIFANGGNDNGAGTYSATGTIYMSEIFDPETLTWSVAADSQESRQYHSTALLIPDGRIVTAGEWAAGGRKYHKEIYSPPYLFADDGSLAARPEITTVADSWAYSEVVPVSYGTTDVVSAHLIMLGAVTHATNFTQRLVPLDVVSNSNGTIEVTSPSGGTIAPPGHYMLFLMNEDGVPSVAEIVQVGVKEGNGSDIVLGNDTSTDGNFIDGHHPSLYVNETDTYTASGSVTVDDFKFYARRLGNPITPLMLVQNADNDYTVVAVGTTRPSSQYSTGENTFPFSDSGPVSLLLNEGDVLVTGFMDANPNGTGWGGGSVIPADTQSNPDEIYDILPFPLKSQTTPYNANVVTGVVELGERLLTTNASGLNAGSLQTRGNLARSYKFAVTLSEGSTTVIPTGENLMVNGSFEQPSVTTWSLSGSVPGWSSNRAMEIDRTPWPASDGAQSTDMNGANSPTTIQQSVTGLEPGATYALSFDYASHPNARAATTMNVTVNGSVIDAVSSPATVNPPAYTSKTVSFTAPANGTATISFAGTNSGGTGVVLDNVGLFAAVSGNSNLLNGSFEEPIVQTYAFMDNIPGWTTVAGPIEVDRTPWPAADGSQSIDLGGVAGAEISQTLTGLTPGQDYSLTYAYGAHFQVEGNVSATVKINGAVAETITAGVGTIPPAYNRGAVSFTAPASGQVTVGFASVGSESKGVVLDDVAVSAGIVNNVSPTIANGSFEEPVVQTFSLFGSLPGWDVVSGPVEVDRTPWPAASGAQSLDIGAGRTGSEIAQTVQNLTPGQRYTLSYSYGAHFQARSNVTARVLVNGAVAATLTAGPNDIPPAYKTGSVSFTAPASGEVTVGFASVTASIGVVIDNVEIAPSGN